MSAQFAASTSGKKIANWTVGKIMLLVLGAQLAAAAPAHAVGACEAQKQLAPRKGERAPEGRPPFALGDSVMLGAADALAHAGIRVDARGCRQVSAGLEILARRARAGRLPRVVVVQLGTNLDVSRADIARMVRILGKRRNLVLVTPPNGGSDPARMRRAARRRDRVCLADWARIAARHPEYAPGDGIHLSASGIRAFTRMLKPYRRVKARRPGACAR
jgi:hypothetical protein